jgi:dipeptidase D
VQKLMPLCITKLEGGAKDNAIPRSSSVSLVLLGINPERINDVTEVLQAEIRQQFDEPEAVIYGDNLDALGGNALTAECTGKVIALLNAAPNGVQSWSADIEGLVQTSLNLGVVRMAEELTLTFAVRSSVNQEKRDLLQMLSQLAQFHEGSYSEVGDYPAWEYKKDSRLRDTMVRVFTEMYHRKPEVVAIHAGLECGLLSEKLPGLDCVSIGPDMKDIHTSREKLDIASVKRTWEYLLAVLREL